MPPPSRRSFSSLAIVVVPVVLVLALSSTLLGLNQRVATRRYEPERQDLSMEEGSYTLEEFQDMMVMLAEINRADWKGGYLASLSLFEQLSQEGGNISSILEIGFGRGDFSIMLARKFPGATVLGIDAHALSVQTAQGNLASQGSSAPGNVRFELRPAVELSEPPDTFDVITTTLVNHHIFPDTAFVDFLRRVRVTGRRAFVFNDLVRSPACYVKTVALSETLRLVGGKPFLLLLGAVREVLTALGVPLWLTEEVSTGLRYLQIFEEDRPGASLVLDGGIASVERAFTPEELQALFLEAGFAAEALQCSFSGVAALSFEPCRMACLVDLTK